MVIKTGGKTTFDKKCQKTLRVKNFIKITLSGTVSEINAFLRFT